jgi:1-acyl-sn-glycerol-3-phosphate acyltransferase
MQTNQPIKQTIGTEFNFDDIRPFYDHESRAMLHRLIDYPLFFKLVNFLWPQMTMEQVLEKANKVHTNVDFQLEFMDAAIRTILSRSSTNLTYSGFENIDPTKAYLFVGNHRDILLDSAILQILLNENGFSTSEITFGNNLMEQGFITEFGKLNRMFAVQREGTSKELFLISKKLSAYIRHTIVDKNTSVWIAQRNGRTKDGLDATQTGLLKMLNLSGNQNFEKNFSQLQIVPLTISYQYEPCDFLKVEELHLSSLHSKYKKEQGEDFNSILTGVNQQKGNIHLSVGKPIGKDLEDISKISNDNEKIKVLAQLIDQKIYSGYKLWPQNYIAVDLLENSAKNNKNYTEEEKNNFIIYMNKSIEKIQGEPENLKQFFLKLYANPVFSALKNAK